jgi:hypothetical protein
VRWRAARRGESGAGLAMVVTWVVCEGGVADVTLDAGHVDRAPTGHDAGPVESVVRATFRGPRQSTRFTRRRSGWVTVTCVLKS